MTNLGGARGAGFFKHKRISRLAKVKSLISSYGDDPDYQVKTKKSCFHGKTLEELEQIRDEIEARRRGGKPSALQLKVRFKRLKKTLPPGSARRRKAPFDEVAEKMIAWKPSIPGDKEEEELDEKH